MDTKELERQIRDVYSTLMYGLLKLNKRIIKIEPGSGNVNTVNGKTGDVVLDASDVGAIASIEKGAADGVATLGNDGKIPNSQLPAIPAGNLRMSLLWENSDTTQSFSTQNITLSSSDYDLLLWVYKVTTTTNRCCSQITVKGSGVTLSIAEFTTNSASNRTRVVNRATDTEFNVDAGRTNGNQDNTQIIPHTVYGIKLL